MRDTLKKSLLRFAYFAGANWFKLIVLLILFWLVWNLIELIQVAVHTLRISDGGGRSLNQILKESGLPPL